MTEKIDFENMVGSELLEYISFKDEFPNEAEMAFYVFQARYQRDILQKSEVLCSKFEYNEAIAFLAATCTFDKVWKNAHTFNMKKQILKMLIRPFFYGCIKYYSPKYCFLRIGTLALSLQKRKICH